MKKTVILPFILILFFSLMLAIPLFSKGLFTIHDDQQVARLFLFHNALQDGQFPPRMVDKLGFGFGYPLFVFYPPLAYFIAEIVHVIGFSLTASIKMVFFLSIFLSGSFIYILVKKYYGTLPALTASLFYMFLPYRAVDIYVRGALAESFSFIFIPLIFYFYLKFIEEKTIKISLATAMSLALLLLAHNLVFISFLTILPFLFIFIIFSSKEKLKTLYLITLSLVLAAGISAFFWIPALFEKSLTLVDKILLTELADYKIHFVELSQLWNSTWGFGGSTKGVLDGISFKIGKIHLIAAALAIFFSTATATFLPNKNLNKYKLQFSLGILFTVILIFSAFMTTNFSELIWFIFKPLQYLQFPWRFLLFTGFAASILAGALLYFLRLTYLKIIVFVLLILFLVFYNLKLFKPQSYRSYFTDEYATQSSLINWEVSKSSFEYLPKDVAVTKGPLNTTIVDITKEEIPKNKIDIISGDGNINLIETKSNRIALQTKSLNNLVLRANITNFPNWVLKIDGVKTNFSDNNKYKLVEFVVPSGNHRVSIEFNNTYTRLTANLISMFFISLLPIIYLWKNKKF